MSDILLLTEAQALHARGDHAGAAAICRAILGKTPDDPAALHLLGVILSEVGLHSEAVPVFEHAIALGGAEPALLYNYGMTLRSLGRMVLAARAFHLAANNNVTDVDSWSALGMTRLALKQFDTAVAALSKALELAPDRADIRANLALAQIGLGVAQQHARDFETAHANLMAAIANAPDNPQAHSNLGNVLRDMGRFGEAQAAFARALDLDPDDTAVIANRALASLHGGDVDAAITGYARAVALEPGNEPLHSNLAQALLMAGRFAEGWAEFEHRLADPVIAARLAGLPGRRWRGEALAGRSIILVCEQGLGDAIQFARYLPILTASGARVYLAGPSRLARLLSQLKGLVAYLPDGGPMPAADLHAPLLSVPHLLGATTIPNDVPYIASDPDLAADWAARLGSRPVSGGRRHIGIAWQGNPAYEMDYLRSIPSDFMADLVASVDARFLILQRGDIPQRLLDAGGEILGPDLDRDHAFLDTAAVMANLDLVITSDTALAHLAGALGCRTFVLLPWAPDWRWRLGRADCDWYPSLRLVRQPQPGDWTGVMRLVRAALTDS